MFPSTFGKLLEIVMSVTEKDDKIMTLEQHLKPHHTLSTGLYNSLCYTNLCRKIIIYIYIYIHHKKRGHFPPMRHKQKDE
jgi:hypothetical protein